MRYLNVLNIGHPDYKLGRLCEQGYPKYDRDRYGDVIFHTIRSMYDYNNRITEYVNYETDNYALGNNFYLMEEDEYYSRYRGNPYMAYMAEAIFYIVELTLKFVSMDFKQQEEMAGYLCRWLYKTYGYNWPRILANYFVDNGHPEWAQAVRIDVILGMHNEFGFVPYAHGRSGYHHKNDDKRYSDSYFDWSWSKDLHLHDLGTARKEWTKHLLQEDQDALSYLESLPTFCFGSKLQGADWRENCLQAGRMFFEGAVQERKKLDPDKKYYWERKRENLKYIENRIQRQLDIDPLILIEDVLEKVVSECPPPFAK